MYYPIFVCMYMYIYLCNDLYVYTHTYIYICINIIEVLAFIVKRLLHIKIFDI